MRTMAETVKERLDALRMNTFEAERRAGLKKGFVNDLLIGRKETIRRNSLEKLARALECDPEFLTGHQITPKLSSDQRARGGEILSSVRFGGVVEAGTWREIALISTDHEDVPTSPDQRFPADAQTAYLVRGSSAARLGINDGSVVIGCDTAAFEENYRRVRDGDAVVVRRWRQNRTEVELSIRIISGSALVSAADGTAHAERNDPDTDVLAVVVRAIRIF